MSAVFTGNGLGLFNTSLSQLGSGLGGGAGVGQGRDAQYVNAATGNLVWQSGDEHLVFRGLAIGLTRTYNSLGQVGDVGADGWLTGFERKVALQNGTFNTTGSVMRRTTGDGSYQDFVWTATNTYQSTGDDGAHDTLTWTGSGWRYVEGSTRREEGYANHADATALGRLTYLRDGRSDGTTPVTWQVIYDANQRISELRADDGTSTGDALIFAYDGSGRLSSVSTRESGTVRLQVSYGYDGQGRLTSVLTDLTPGNTADNTWDAVTASNNNNRLFRTEYTYVGTSLQLASVRQSDGTVVSYTYHADGRLKTVTRGDTNTNDADGAGETLTYTYGTGTTTVTDSLNRAWVYAFDGSGQLTSLTAPAISGQSDITTYLYDGAGNVTQAKTVRGASVLSLVDYAYDSAGNVTWEWDGLGNAISRTWSTNNQLLTLTRYTGVDPDRAGASLPTGGMTTRYIYDAQNRLRFVVDAADQVSEFTYATSGNGIGQQASLRQYLGAGFTGTYDLTSLQVWATATQKASSQLSELTYDTWGRLSQRTDFAAVNSSGVGVLDDATGITRYTYDAQGTLRQQITVRGAARTLTGAALAGSEQVDYAYDGMGRLLSVIQRQVTVADSDATTVQTSYSYLDSGHQVQVTDDVGKVTVQTRDAAGRLISVSAQGVVNGSTQTRTQLNYYDGAGQLRASEDANGGRTYYFYDAKGRLTETVDATGAVSRITYDGADRILSTRQYANRVTTTSWIAAGEVVPTTVTTTDNNTLDRVTGRTYDAAGRLKTETDALASSTSRTITTYTYDAAGRITQAVTTDSAGTTATARTVRSFYDAVGRLIGQLDAAGYLTEMQYDRAGRVLVQTRYATVSPSTYWASGTLPQLKPSLNSDQDQTTRYYYDGRGQQVGMLDAQGYLTERVFDEKGNTRAERRYAMALTWAGSDTLATLRSRAGTAREQRMAYNALGQLVAQTNAEGTVTQYTYDEAGRLVKTEVAQGTSEVREGHLRYNVFGELIGELGGESAPQVLPGMSEAQLDAVYAQYGVRHGYDVLGQRIESIDAAGNRTWYFYDAAGRSTFTVRGVADSNNVANAQGEVTETRYTAFGDVSDQIAYTGRITIAVPGSRDSVQAAVSTLAYSSSIDTRREFTYTARGQVATTTDAVSTQTRYTYDAFGQLQQQVQAYGNAAAVTTQYQYDVRGLQTTVTEGVGAGTAIERSRTQGYDAFGRVISATDARGAVRTFTYDRLGRQLTATQTVQGRVETTSSVYDAHGRVLSVTDAEGQVTSYVHDDNARSLTVTSPEGIVVTTIHNRHGQTVRVADAAGATEYTFDRNGALTKTERKAVDGTVVTAETRQYDTARGLLTAVIDGSGRKVEYQYDAAGRVLRRIQDPAGLALTTTYTYDGQGRQLMVTDPSSRVTGYSYDREGRLTQMAQDPASLNLRTQFTYDALGRQLTMVEGATTTAARTTQYIYDVLGRRTSEVVDPGTGKLNLTTSYAYDKNDNVIRRTDANGQVTRYYYDEANRQVYTVDPLGAMTRQWYDRVGQVVAVRAFAQTTDATTLQDTTTLAQLDARLAWLDNDQAEYRVYDKDGRVRFVLGGGGALTEYGYDAAGRLVSTRVYATSYVPSGLTSALFEGTADPSQISPTADDARDERTWYVRDAAGQIQLTVDALGNVRQLRYDATGRVVGSIAYAQPAALTAPLRTQLQAGTATVTGVLATVTANAAKDVVDHRVHDAAGRLRYMIDAIGAVRETLYDAAGQEVGSRAYAVTVSVDAGLRVKLQAGTATMAEVGGLLTPAIVNDVRNQESYQVRDAAGRVRFTLQVMRDASGNPTGMLSEVRYDQAGRVTERLMRETPITSTNMNAQLAALRAGTASVSTVSGWMTGTTRYTAWVYDAAGRARYTLQADTSTTRTVREQRFDATGQVVAEVAYAVTIPSGTSRTVAAVGTALTTAGGDAANQQRVTLYVRDAAGRVRFQMDDAGAVSELRYDGSGRVVQSRQYAQAISTATAQTEAAMAAAVAGQTGANVRITQSTYDAAGRVSSTIDAAGKTESYGYDAVGRRTSLTNKLGQIWTYIYDAAGRMTEEISPQVSVTTATVEGVVTTGTRSLKTVMAYDALGNVLSRTEDALGAQPRVTQYQYDSRGHQIKTIFPDAWQVDGNGQLVATGQAPSIEVTYDALGQAVAQKDVRGNYSYKVYNSLGQVAYEIDPEGYVSGFTYNAFGEQTQLTRYATKLSFGDIAGFVAGTGLSPSQMTASVVVANAANDRVLTTTYDGRGLKTQVTQSAIFYVRADGTTSPTAVNPTTQFTYNAFGELTCTSVLLDASTGLMARSWQYYDELGRVTLGVDAEGYVTQTQYNALGEVVQVREYAKALAATAQAALTTTAPPPPPAAGDASTGYDRVVSYTYDTMGRKASESVLRYYGRADGSQGVRNVATQWTYDAAGQATVTDVDGQQTKTTYDALGRVSSVQEAAQQRLASTAEAALQGSTGIGLGVQSLYVQVSAYTTLAYDAFGNAVRTVRYANGKVGESAAVADAANDQVSLVAYDRQGRAVMNQDAEGNRVFLQYDAADNITHSWYTLKIGSGADKTVHSYYTYDAAGRQLTSRTERSGEAAPDQLDVVQYNAFGEIIAKGNDLVTLPAQYQYDKSGNLIRSNAEGGAWRDYGYNLAGYQVRESHTVYMAVGNSVTAVTRTTTDRLGRTVAMVLPSHTTDINAVNYLSQKLDRWGNVIELVDPRGYQTTYQYNDRNQLVKEIRPLVEVVTAATPGGSWLRPELSWSYDELGRLVASRDGNGNTTRYEYDGSGKQTKVIDANGSVTLTAYDALGRERISQDALGYLTWKQYDRLDRVTTHGDYLNATSGGTRNKKTLESYVLNQNGQRVQVTNALNQAYKYDYDGRGLLVRSQTPTGVAIQYGYDLGGRRSLERYALTQSTIVDRDGESVKTHEQTWDYDYFGRLIDRNDLGGNDYNYTYDTNSGQLTNETNSLGLSRTTLYYANGLVRQLQEPSGTLYTYAYDQAGNRTLEEAVVKDSRGKQYNVRTTIVYDSHNRLQRVTQDDVTTSKRVFELTYAYDAAGNRTKVVSRTGYGENTAPIDMVDRAPTVIGAPANRTLRSGVASEFRVRLTDLFRDPEGKALSVTAVQVSGGTETTLPSWLSYIVDPNTGEAVFTATGGSSAANGQTLTIRLKASDGASVASNSFALSVRNNTAPVDKAGAVTSYMVKTGRAWALELAASDYFLDEDVGDSLTLTATVSPSAGWLTIDPSNPAVLRLSAAAPVAGTYTVTLRATDSAGAVKTRTVTLTVAANTGPTVVTAVPNQNAVIGRSFLLERDLTAVFQDSHGDPISVIASLADGSPLPSWLSFSHVQNQATPVLRLAGQVPADIADGTVIQIKLSPSDPDGPGTSTTFSITIWQNRAPTVVAVPAQQEARIGQAYLWETSLSNLFSDPEGDQLSLALVHTQGAATTGWLNVAVDSATGAVQFFGTPTNVALQNATYTVRLTATDAGGLTTSLDMTIRVRGNNAPSVNGAVSLPVSVNASFGRPFSFTLPNDLFVDVDGDPINYVVSGYIPEGPSPGFDEPGPPEQFVDLPSWLTYDPSTKKLTGTVPASMGVTFTSVAIRPMIGPQYNSIRRFLRLDYVPFVNSAPVYNTGTLPSRTAVHGGSVNFALPGGAFTEPDGDGMTYTAQVQVGSSWVSLSQIGLSINSSTGAITGTATNLTQASYNVRITATDSLGATNAQSTGTFVLNVTNTPPTAGTIPGQTAYRNASWSYSGVPSYFSDVNQNPLTYSATGLPTGLTIASGTGVISGAPSVALGDYAITVTANDGRGGTASTSFTLTVANAQPGVASPIPNQSAPRNLAFSYAFPSGTFSDINNDTLTYAASNLPAGLSFNAGTRTFSGTPTTLGTTTVTVTANDGQGGSVSTTFTITVTNTAPVVAATIPNQTISRNLPFSYAFPAGTFTDANNDTLTYTASNLPAGLSFNAGTRTFSGTPSAVGTTMVTVTANDGLGGTKSTTFTITVTNTAPVLATPLTNQSVPRNNGFSYTFPSGTFTDANNDALTYTASNLPAGISFNAGTRTFSGTPTALGTTTVTVTANDGFGGTQSATFTINVYNIAPVYVGGLQNRIESAGAAVNWPLPGGAFTDANSDALSYTVMIERPGYNEEYIGPFNEPLWRWHDPVWMTVSWLTANPSTGTITGNAYVVSLPGEAGINADGIARDYRVKVIASDGMASAEGIFNVNVNTAPQAVGVSAKTIKQNSWASIGLPAFNDNGSLTYSVSGLPSGLSFDPGSRVISGTTSATGTFTITYSAVDAGGLSASTTFTITSQANNAPSAPGVGNLTLTRGVAHDSTLPSFSDPDYDQLSLSVTGLPPGMTASGSHIYGTPSASGTYTVTYSANDGRGGVASTTFQIIVNEPVPVNQAPTVQNPIPDRFAASDRNWSYAFPANTFYDPNGDTLTYTASNMPGGMSFNASTRTFSMRTPKNTLGAQFLNITVTANDGRGGTVSDSFNLYVEPWEGMSSPLSEGMEEQMFLMGEEGIEGGQTLAMAGLVAIEDTSWFAYDKMNRVVVANGQLSGNQVVLRQGYNSYGTSYDAVGNAVAQQRWKYEGAGVWTMQTTQQVYSQRKQITLSFGDGYTTKQVYDEVGRLTERTSFFGSGAKYTWIDDEGNIVPVNVSGMLASYESNTYDVDGRLLTQVSRTRGQDTVLRTPVGYPAKPQQNLLVWVGQVHDGMLLGGLNQYSDTAVLGQVGTVSYTGVGRGYDAAGRVIGYSYQSDASGTSNDYTHTFTYAYEARDSYLEKTVTGNSTNSAYKVTTSTMTYDAAGRQTEIREHTEGASLDDRVRSFALDGSGMILGRRDGTLDGSTFEQNQTGEPLRRLNQHYVYAAGQQVAGLDEAGKLDVLSRLTAFGNSDAGRTQVVVQAGETLRNLAQRVYGSADLWYVIAGANGLESDADLVAGTSLTVPEVRTASNDASTFKPYNPGEITGPTSPGLPYIAPADAGCNVAASLIILAVVVIVTAYTAGAAAGAMGSVATGTGAAGTTASVAAGAATATAGGGVAATMATGASVLAGGYGATAMVVGGAAGAFAGSVAGQAAGKAMGVVDHFSLRDATQAGLSAGLTAGLGNMGLMQKLYGALEGMRFAQAAVQAAAGQLTSYAASRIAGTEVSFSWRKVAVSAVSAGVTSTATPTIASTLKIDTAIKGGLLASDLVSGVLSGTLAMHASRKLGPGSDVDYGQVLSDAFGNALAGAMQRASAQKTDAAASLQAQWQPEDAIERQRMIDLEEWGYDPADPWGGAQGGIAGLPADVRTLSDITLVPGADPSAATRTTYHTELVDPYLIERNGGSVDQWNVVNTYAVRDASPVLMEALAADAVSQPVQPVSWTEARNASLQASQDSALEYWDNFGMRAAARAGYSVAQGGNSLLGIFIDPVYSRKVEAGLVYAATHPKAVGVAIVSEAKAWWEMPLGQKAEGAAALGLETLATAGTGLVVRGSRTAHVVTEVAEEAAEMAARHGQKLVPEVVDQAGEVLGNARVPNNALVDAEVSALQRIAANNSVDTGSAARMARIDELTTANYNRLLQNDLAGTDYVYRAVPENMLDIYRDQGSISGRGGSSTYFSLEGGASPLQQKLGAQLLDEPQVLLKIPTSELVGPTVPRPFGYSSVPQTIGREYFVNSYPQYGAGGFRQFMGTTNSYSDSWIVSPWGAR